MKRYLTPMPSATPHSMSSRVVTSSTLLVPGRASSAATSARASRSLRGVIEYVSACTPCVALIESMRWLLQ